MVIPKVAIACQGGGTHAAFGAGVLLHLFGPEARERFRVVALSGTSGGAMSAALIWRGLVSSGPDEATERLLGFWRTIEATDAADAWINFWDVWAANLPVTVNMSPYASEPLAEPRLRQMLRSHLELERLTTDPARRGSPKLFIGATDVLQGDRIIFRGEALTYDHVIASSAVPPLFRAVRAGEHLCWDGVFTTNPPVREFTDLDDPPDEIWVIQVNPQRRTREPRSLRQIKDRTNELSGNLSLGQELYFIETINRLLERYPALRAEYSTIRVRVVEFDAKDLGFPAKLDRSSAFIGSLIEAGRERARLFFEASSFWPRESTTPARSVLSPDGAPM